MHGFGMQAREDLAKSLIAAILKHTGRREQSTLERIECQMVSSLFLQQFAVLCNHLVLFSSG